MSDIQDLTRMVNTLKRRVEEHEQIVRRPLLKQREPKKDRLHFLVEQVGGTIVAVHGGVWTRGIITPSLSVTTITRLLTTDAGTSELYAGIKTYDVPLHRPYVNLLLDSATAPTTVSVETTNSPPGSANVRKVIAHLTWTGDVITDIEQVWTGGDITDHWHASS